MPLLPAQPITLLEEDNPLRAADVQALQALGCQVTTAETPAEILRPGSRPEIVVIAVNPGRGARQAAAGEALQQAVDAPLILLIADDALAELDAFESLLYAACVTRSADPRLLRHALRIAPKRADLRRELIQVETHLHEALQGAHTGAWDWAVGTDVCHFTPEYTAMLGCTPADLADSLTRWQALVHPDDLPLTSAAMEAHLRGETADYQNEHRVRGKDGGYHWMLDRGRIVERGPAGEPLRVAGTYTDITRRKLAEVRLQRWESIFEHLPWGIVASGMDGKTYAMVNPAFASMHGATVDELLGASILDSFAPDCRADAVRHLQASMARKTYTFDSWHLRKDGSRFPVQINITGVRDGAGVFEYGLVNVQDISERLERETAVLGLQGRLQEVLENALDAAYKRDLRANAYEYMSPVIARLTGYSADEFIHLPLEAVLDSIHPDDLPGLQRALGESLTAAPGASREVEYRFRRKTGGYVWLQDRYAVMHGADGQPTALIGSVSDITQRKQAELALQSSENQFRMLFESSMDGILITHPDGQIFDANPAACRMLGKSREEVLQGGRAGVVNAADPRLIPAMQERARAGFYRGELTFLRRDGTPFPVELTSVIDRSPSGNSQTHILFRDISQRKQTETFLRESEERFRLLAETVPVLIWLSDAQGNCTYFNARWLAYTGRSMQQELGSRWMEGMHPDDLQRCSAIFQHANRYHQEFEMEYRLRRADGEYGILLDHGVPHFTPSGEFLGFIGGCTDITERATVEKLLREYSDTLTIAMDIAGLASWEIDLATDEFIFNDRFYALYGTDARDEGGYRMPPARVAERFIHPEDQPLLLDLSAAAPHERARAIVPYTEQRMVQPDGSVRWLGIYSHAERDAAGKLVRLHGVNQDVTARKQHDEQIRFQARLLSAVKQAVIATDLDGRYLYWNPYAEELFGFRLADVLGKRTPNLSMEFGLSEDTASIRRQALENLTVKTELSTTSSRGEPLVLEATTSLLLDEQGRPTGYIGILDEISERKREQMAIQTANEELIRQLGMIESLQEELREQVLHDPLTGLYNRRYFAEALNQELLRAERENSPLSVIITDIDHFKVINDTYGHQAGDLVLVEIANMLTNCVRGSDFICRYGGEEFLLVLPRTANQAALKRAEDLRQRCAEIATPWQDTILRVTISLGVATFPDDGPDADRITAKADRALYHSKQTGRNRVTGWQGGQLSQPAAAA